MENPRIMSKWTLRLALACLVGLGSSTASQAAYRFEFDQAEYQVNPGENVTVSLFVAQDGGSDLLTTEGLFGVSTQLFYNEAPFASDPAQILALADIVRNPQFDDPLSGPSRTLATGGSRGTAEYAFAVLNVLAPVFPPALDPNRILLVTYTFKAGSIEGERTSLRALALDILTGEGTDLTGLTLPGESSILIIPEPATALLVVLALPLAWVGNRRLRLA